MLTCLAIGATFLAVITVLGVFIGTCEVVRVASSRHSQKQFDAAMDFFVGIVLAACVLCGVSVKLWQWVGEP